MTAEHAHTNVLLLYFSRTDTTARVARDIARILEEDGCAPDVRPIMPRLRLPYPVWLLMSFMPGMKVPVEGLEFDPTSYDLCLLIFPKWTLVCPPVEEALSRIGMWLPPTALVITCGGFDAERYARSYRGKLERLGVKVIGREIVKRSKVGRCSLAARLARVVRDWVKLAPRHSTAKRAS